MGFIYGKTCKHQMKCAENEFPNILVRPRSKYCLKVLGPRQGPKAAGKARARTLPAKCEGIDGHIFISNEVHDIMECGATNTVTSLA